MRDFDALVKVRVLNNFVLRVAFGVVAGGE
jgi:hypothetical protein